VARGSRLDSRGFEMGRCSCLCVQARHQSYCERAVQEALKSPIVHKVGCVIVKDNKIVAASHNQFTVNHICHSWSVHAEVAALLQLRKQPRRFFRDCVMYVVRVGTESMDYPLKLSKPCEACEALITAVGIRRVYYSTNDQVDALIAEELASRRSRNPEHIKDTTTLLQELRKIREINQARSDAWKRSSARIEAPHERRQALRRRSAP